MPGGSLLRGMKSAKPTYHSRPTLDPLETSPVLPFPHVPPDRNEGDSASCIGPRLRTDSSLVSHRCVRKGSEVVDRVASLRWSELSPGHPVVIGMCTNPEPEDAIFNLNSQRPVVKTNPHGPEDINLLEVQRRVVGVSL